MYWAGILAAALAIGLSIMLHECGHFILARLFKVKVTQFMVGFGPTLLSRRAGETEYGVKALPLGGFIRMTGMTPRPATRDAGETFWSRLINDTREGSWRDAQPGDDARAFYRLPPWKKILVMMGGPLVNLAICVILLGVLFVGIGLPEAGNVVGRVNPCTPVAAAPGQVLPSADLSGGLCPPGVPLSPAATSGLRAGDRFVSVDGAETPTWAEVVTAVRARADQTVDIVVERDGTLVSLPVPVSEFTPEAGGPAVGYLGVGPAVVSARQPWTAIPEQMGAMVAAAASRLVTMPAGVVSVAESTVTGQERPADSPVSVVGVTRISGEIAAAPEEPTPSKVATLISIIAGVNLFLFLFNMLPVLPLDGGHVASALWESARRRLARWRRRPDPGPVDVAVMAPVAYVFAMALFAVSAVIILADIINPIRVSG